MKKFLSLMVVIILLGNMMASPVCSAKTVSGSNKYTDNTIAEFSNAHLEKWVRKTLKKSASAKIRIKDLDRITSIAFVGGQELTGKLDYSYDANFNAVIISGKKEYHFNYYNLKDFTQFRRLKELSIIGEQIADLSPLKGMKLTKLDLTCNHITDLTPLSSMDTLEYLNVQGNPVKSISPLSKLGKLSYINLANTPVKEIAGLKSLKKLATLDISFTKVKNISVGPPNITYINLLGSECTNLEALKKYKKLTDICLSSFTQKQADSIKNLKITSLTLLYSGDELNTMTFPLLKRLELYHITLSDLSFLKNSTKLQELYIYGMPLSDISAAAGLKELRTLEIHQTDLYNITPLGGLKNLRNVTIPDVSKASYLKIADKVSWKARYDSQRYRKFTIPHYAGPGAGRQIEPTKIASAAPHYVKLSNAGAYNKAIITDELFTRPSALPEASNSLIPYWKGINLETKASVNNNWLADTNWHEEDIKFLHDNGFNCARIVLSFSFFSKKGDKAVVNESELEQLDELIAWGMKYDVHILISMIGLPNQIDTDVSTENVGGTGGDNLFNSKGIQEEVKAYWSLLAERYQTIPNKYLSFNLFAEPNTASAQEDAYSQICVQLAQAIWRVEGNKDKDNRRIVFVDNATQETMRQGCAVSIHYYAPHRFANPDTGGYYSGYPYIPLNETWPVMYLPQVIFPDEGKNTLTIQSEGAFQKGTKISIYTLYDSNTTLEILTDGKIAGNILRPAAWDVTQNNQDELILDSDVKEIKIKNTGNDWYHFNLIKIEQPGKKTVYLVPHDFANNIDEEVDTPPMILVSGDGSVQNNDTPKKIVDWDYLYTSQLKSTLEEAKALGVGVMVTETLEDYVEYGDWSKVSGYASMVLRGLKENNIAWTACTLHGIFFPSRKNADVAALKDTPYLYDKDLIQLFKKYE